MENRLKARSWLQGLAAVASFYGWHESKKTRFKGLFSVEGGGVEMVVHSPSAVKRVKIENKCPVSREGGARLRAVRLQVLRGCYSAEWEDSA